VTKPVSLPFLLYVGYSFPLWLHVMLLYFLHDHSKWCTPSSSITTFEHVSGFFLSAFWSVDASALRKLCFKCSTLVVSSLNLISYTGESSLLFIECHLCNENVGFIFACTHCIVCYQAHSLNIPNSTVFVYVS